MNTSFIAIISMPNGESGKVQFFDSKTIIFDDGTSFPITDQIPVLLPLTETTSKQDFYEGFYQAEAEPWGYSERAAEKLRHEYIAQQVEDICKQNNEQLVILDLGCSLGHITALLHPYGELIVGLDISITAALKAKNRCEALVKEKNNPYQFMVGDVLNLPFQKEVFDVVIISDGIHEWFGKEEDREKSVQNVFQVLKKGGKAIFTDYINPKEFKNFTQLVQTSPFSIEREDFFYDRLWYRLESWTKALRHQTWVKSLLADINFAKKLRIISKFLGKNYSKHLAIIAKK
jgi:SAM-dependent methyltransferase